MMYKVSVVAAVLLASGASAFSVRPAAVVAAKPAAMTRHSHALVMQEEEESIEVPSPEPVADPEPPAGWKAVTPELWGPDKKANFRVEGGSTLKTFKMPPNAERVQYVLMSPNGRPVKAKVELWIGPIRCVHEVIYDCMFGGTFPLRATLQFKKLSPVLKVSTDSSFEFPLLAGVFVPDDEESKVLGETCEDMFYSAPMKEVVQGGFDYHGKAATGGAIRTFNVDPSWDKTQIMVWSKDVGKKSFKTNIEVLQGPNNAKQFINLRCGGSTQPYHCVIDTPGPDWMIRLNSKKFLEDGKFEVAVAPYEESAEVEPVSMGGIGSIGGSFSF